MFFHYRRGDFCPGGILSWIPLRVNHGYSYYTSTLTVQQQQVPADINATQPSRTRNTAHIWVLAERAQTAQSARCLQTVRWWLFCAITYRRRLSSAVYTQFMFIYCPRRASSFSAGAFRRREFVERRLLCSPVCPNLRSWRISSIIISSSIYNAL